MASGEGGMARGGYRWGARARACRGWLFAVIAGGGVLVALAGCATPPPRTDRLAYATYRHQDDPLKPMNEAFYRINHRLNVHVVNPASRTYLDVTSLWFRTHAGYFARNLDAPREILLFMASGKPRDAGTMLVRFLVNSTVGIGGVFDPARALGYRRVDTDLGLTLALYGVPSGPYLFVPAAGPSNARDALASLGGVFISPIPISTSSAAGATLHYAAATIGTVNQRSSLNATIAHIESSALDPYAVFRSLYRQHRAAQLRQINRRDRPTIPDWYGSNVRRQLKRLEITRYEAASRRKIR